MNIKRSTQILRGSIRQRMMLSFRLNHPIQPSMRYLSTDKNASKSNATDDQKDAAGFNIFEQLKAQQSGQKSEGFEESPEMDEREKARLKREAEKAEKDVNERQRKTFGVGSLITIFGSLGLYIYLGNASTVLIIGLATEDEQENPDESAFSAHNRRVYTALTGYYNVLLFLCVK